MKLALVFLIVTCSAATCAPVSLQELKPTSEKVDIWASLYLKSNQGNYSSFSGIVFCSLVHSVARLLLAVSPYCLPDFSSLPRSLPSATQSLTSGIWWSETSCQEMGSGQPRGHTYRVSRWGPACFLLSRLPSVSLTILFFVLFCFFFFFSDW